MAIRLNEMRRNPSTGRLERTGRQEVVGRRRGSSGGFEQGTVGTYDPRTGETNIEPGAVSNERGALIEARLEEERRAAEKVRQDAQAAKEQRQVVRTMQSDQAVASTVGPGGRPSVIRQTTGGFSAVAPGGVAGFGVEARQTAVPIAGAGPAPSKPQPRFGTGVVQPAPIGVEQRLERFSSRQGDVAERSRGRDTLGGLRASGLAFVAGVAISGIRTAKFGRDVVTSPIQTTKSVGLGILDFARSPIQSTVSTVNAAGLSFTSNPARFTGVVAGDVATGIGVDRAFRTSVRTVRFAGKPSVAAEQVIAPTYLSGEEIYPTGTPRAAVRVASSEQRVFSAMPQAPEGGRSFTVLTQQQKVSKGLDLSETGGLYSAPRVSPVFTQVVTKGEGSSTTFSVIPRLGVPGAVAEIQTDATRLPRSVRSTMQRERNIRAGNAFLDEGGAVRANRRTAYTTPATELGIKTESELIIPGGTRVERTNQYGFFSRALGRDFDYYVRVPESPGSQRTVPVAFRRYRNVGFDDSVTAQYASRRIGATRKTRTSSLSDIEYYSAPRRSTLGLAAYPSLYRPTSSSVNLRSTSSSLFGTSARSSASPVGRVSSSISPFNLVSSSSPFRSSSFFSSNFFSRSTSSFTPSTSSRRSASSSFDLKMPEFSSPFLPPQGGRLPKTKSSRSNRDRIGSSVFAPSFTALAFNVRGRGRSRQSSGFTGLEVRGI